MGFSLLVQKKNDGLTIIPPKYIFTNLNFLSLFNDQRRKKDENERNTMEDVK